MKKILFVVGSLRRDSFNHLLAETAEKLLAGRAEVAYLDYSDVPFVNQDVEFPAPDAIVRVRKEVQEADALWIFTPEYNYQIPSALKNLLDWLSRPVSPEAFNEPSAIAGTKVALASAAGASAGANVRGHLTSLLEFIKCEVIEPQTGVKLPMEAFTEGVYAPTDEDAAQLSATADALIAAIA